MKTAIEENEGGLQVLIHIRNLRGALDVRICLRGLKPAAEAALVDSTGGIVRSDLVRLRLAPVPLAACKEDGRRLAESRGAGL